MKELKDIPFLEAEKIKRCKIFTNHGFLVSISDKDGNTLFSPYMINNFSIDGDKLFITLFDLIQENNIEESLDNLINGFWIFKPKVKICLIKLDAFNEEVYTVDYINCKLNKYHGKNFTYRGSDLHQWYLEFSFSKKKIIKNKNYQFVNIDKDIEYDVLKSAVEKTNNLAEDKTKELAMLKNTNKMLNDAIETVNHNKKSTPSSKKHVISQIKTAISENNDLADRVNNDKMNLRNLEKKMVKQLNNLESNINI